MRKGSESWGCSAWRREGSGVTLLQPSRTWRGPTRKDEEGLFTEACSNKTRDNSFKLEFNLKEGGFKLDIQKKLFTVRLEQHVYSESTAPQQLQFYFLFESKIRKIQKTSLSQQLQIQHPSEYHLFSSACCFPNLCSPVGGLNPHLLTAHFPVNRVKFILVEKLVCCLWSTHHLLAL